VDMVTEGISSRALETEQLPGCHLAVIIDESSLEVGQDQVSTVSEIDVDVDAETKVRGVVVHVGPAVDGREQGHIDVVRGVQIDVELGRRSVVRGPIHRSLSTESGVTQFERKLGRDSVLSPARERLFETLVEFAPPVAAGRLDVDTHHDQNERGQETHGSPKKKLICVDQSPLA